MPDAESAEFIFQQTLFLIDREKIPCSIPLGLQKFKDKNNKPKVLTMQTVCFFAAQPYSLTVGKPDGFKTADDFYRFAADECGFEGVTLPAGSPFINIEEALRSSMYRDDLQAKFRAYGLKEGIVRLETHVVSQNICLHSSRRLKMGPFVSSDFRSFSHRQLEDRAAKMLRDIIDLSHLMGFRYLPGFSGGRGYAVAQAKWSAWPAYLREWIFALLAYKWIPNLEYAADRKQVKTFEFGHPENDILTGENFFLFYKLLTPKARKAVGVNADKSHFDNVLVDFLPHFQKAAETGCEFSSHYKGGAVFETEDGSVSPYGGWRSWSTASSSFFTIGTVGSVESVRKFHHFHKERDHLQKQHGGSNPIVYEGECVGIQNPKQAMEVGAHNCRALRDGTPLARLFWKYPLLLPERNREEFSSEPFLEDYNGRIDLDPWSGGPFDAFADTPVSAIELLEVDTGEEAGCRQILEAAGYTKAASVK
jgi:hypothetical protein